MSLNLKLVVGGAVLLLTSVAQAQTTGLELARSKACMACHQVDSKRVGPPLNSVAERYAGHPEAIDYLANKIRMGGRGAWGAVPMPAQSHVSPEEARQLAQWVLSLTPAKKP
ncbi:c-type cytochrome [Bordetella holmesii]|uniref:Cytochrome C-552 n=2 Tax=Bordetella holmesii TaxID=35814 RepID=A0A158M0M1_9BORD|nr:c-type cytochrome [Bordetella holmesii]AIT26790.1 cytochrome c-552 [Bordetella holmesii 44057]EWM43307.1 cytochrome c-552 [Bordetella holmesii 41130]EWM47377.1 cytochrome c-552 [Bordetella holmesii 35009]AMD45737.1 cytochrome C [Bordetella holmesii H558]AMD48843.1 cytochrome C552 [Bordetella holmesii F627]